MTYESGDDPQLIIDLRAALRRWRRPTLGDTPLACNLLGVEMRLAADRRISRSNALRKTILAAFASTREGQGVEQVELLERRYLRQEGVVWLARNYHVSERTLYLRLAEACAALAHALWILEQPEVAIPVPVAPTDPSRALWRARHLPPPTCDRLLGMDEELARLLDYLGDRDGRWVICLDGMAGLGKTALAREAAGRLAEGDRFADIAWVSVRHASYTPGPTGPDLPALTCGQVLDAMASQLGDEDVRSLDLLAKRDRVRELLHDRACLVVLDNLETVMDCGTLPSWFWEMANPSKLLFTSRHWLEMEVGQSVVSLDQRSETDSLAILRHEAHLRGLPEAAEASDDALRPIVAVTGGNPLALRLVVGHLASLPLDRILEALEAAQPGTQAFYQYLYAISWDLISTAAQELLLRIAELPAGGESWDHLSAASGLPDDDLMACIGELVTHSLLQAVGFETKRYSLHPLTRNFVLSQAVDRARVEPAHQAN